MLITKQKIEVNDYDSAVIKKSVYNHDTKTLVIFFASGKVYRYENVSEQTYYQFVYDDSQGEYFNMYIRDAYDSEIMETSELRVDHLFPIEIES